MRLGEAATTQQSVLADGDPLRMPVPNSPAAIQAMRRQRANILNRSGRTSTRLAGANPYKFVGSAASSTARAGGGGGGGSGGGGTPGGGDVKTGGAYRNSFLADV
jgi:hypothetical protein